MLVDPAQVWERPRDGKIPRSLLPGAGGGVNEHGPSPSSRGATEIVSAKDLRVGDAIEVEPGVFWEVEYLEVKAYLPNDRTHRYRPDHEVRIEGRRQGEAEAG